MKNFLLILSIFAYTALAIAIIPTQASAMSDNTFKHCHYKATGIYLDGPAYSTCLKTYK